MIETTINVSQCFDLESLDSMDAVNFPLPDQSRDFLSHGSLVDKFSDDAGIQCLNDVNEVGHNFNLGNIVDSKKNSELEAMKFYLDEFSNCIESKTEYTNGGGSSHQSNQIDQASSGSGSMSNSEVDESMNENNLSISSVSYIDNDSLYASLGGSDLSYWTGTSNMDEANMKVLLLPDYVVYQDNYYLGLRVTFSQSHVQISDYNAFENHGAFNVEFAVADLIDIKSQLFQSNEAVMIKLCGRSSNTNQMNHVSCSSGIEELKIAFVDSNWSQTLNQITSLNSRYSAVWKIAPEVDVEGNEYFSCGPRSYIPHFEVAFDELVYPKGDPDAVLLSKRDFDLLQPDTYINDTLIDFYIQYLKNNIPDYQRTRFHFFNSFFFRKLADLDRDPSSAYDGKAAFQRVHKWTRKVNIFEKDYIFIPVNYNLHWSLLVICHPGEVANFVDKKLKKSLRVPCILHMDSVKGFHGGLKDLMRSYLYEEWIERQNIFGEDVISSFLTMPFLSVAVPQQQNAYDCGLFLLHYLELFLEEAPYNFNPLQITKFSNFLNLNWFQPGEAYLKRTLIRRLIFELAENHGSQGGFSPDDSGEQHWIDGESSTSHSGEGIEMTVFDGSTFPMKQVFGISDHARGESSRGVSSYYDSDIDDIGIIENFPVQGQQNYSSIESKLDHWNLPDINAFPHAEDIPIHSFMELIPLHSNSSYGATSEVREFDPCDE